MSYQVIPHNKIGKLKISSNFITGREQEAMFLLLTKFIPIGVLPQMNFIISEQLPHAFPMVWVGLSHEFEVVEEDNSRAGRIPEYAAIFTTHPDNPITVAFKKL